MSLSMSAFHSGSKWEVKAVAGGGGQEWESGDRQAVPRLTHTQAEPLSSNITEDKKTKKEEKKKSILLFLSLFTCQLWGEEQESEKDPAEKQPSRFGIFKMILSLTSGPISSLKS